VLTEDYGHNRTVMTGEPMRQAQQVLVVSAETTTDHVRHHHDMKGRLFNHIQRQLHHGTSRAAFLAAALLSTRAVYALEAVGAYKTDSMGILADDTIGA